MKIIILIISSNNNNRYFEMENIWRKYMNNHENIKSFFIKNDINIEEDYKLCNDVIYFKNYESTIPGVLEKTIKGIEYCINKYEFDYIYRVNLSTIIDLNKLYYFLLINSINYGGYELRFNDNNMIIRYTSGTSICLSKIICNEIIKNKTLLNYNYYDDVAIGYLLTDILRYNINQIDLYWINSINDQIFLQDFNNINIFQFRCKIDETHSITTKIMDKIYNKIYN